MYIIRNVLLQHIYTNVLEDSRVSVKSLGLSCITAALDIYPYTCITLDSVESHLQAKDPKLRSQAVLVCTVSEVISIIIL